ncbi:MAG: two-component regulator propeller domain-containing protein [Spirosomataceae bacterium]
MQRIFNQILVLVFTLLLLGSCHGQTQRPLQNTERVLQPTEIAKINKAQAIDPFASVGCSLQSNDGALWFGTNGNGLYRFDGTRFRHYTVADGLITNVIWSLLEDKNGILWIGTQRGLCRFDGKKFEQVPIIATNLSYLYTSNQPVHTPPTQNGVWSMLQDRHGVIWLGTSDGVYCFDGTYFSYFTHQSIINKQQLSLKVSYSILEDKVGNIWFASGEDEGICRFDGRTLSSITPPNFGNVYHIAQDQSGNLWFATARHSICRYDGYELTKRFFKTPNGADIAHEALLAASKTGKLWFADYTQRGVIYAYSGQSLTQLSTKEGLPNEPTWFVMDDNAGNQWFGTQRLGLYRYDGKTFTSFSE